MVNVEKLLGMALREAERVCDRHGMRLRINRQDDKHFVGTCDYRLDRVNVDVDDGKVSKVSGIG